MSDLRLPSPGELLGVVGDALMDEQDIAYNAHCTAAIVGALLEQRAAGIEPPSVRTFYPNDDETSADTVTLDRDGNVAVLDPRSR